MIKRSQVRLVVMFYEFGIGGIQRRIKSVIEEVLDTQPGSEVLIVLRNKTANEMPLPKSDRIKVHYFLERRDDPRKFQQVLFPLWILGIIMKARPTHVLAFLDRFSVYAVFFKRILFWWPFRFRVVINEGIFTSKYLEQYSKPVWKKMVKMFYKGADCVIVPTKAVRDDLKINFEVPVNNIRVIPSWVEEDSKINKKKIYDCVYVGRLSSEKGIDILVDLAKLFKDEGGKHKIAVAGDGEMKYWLYEQILKFKLYDVIEYLGFQLDVKKVIKQSKILLLPSENEGLPMSVLEANSVAVPAVVTPFKGAYEVVKKNISGIVSKRKDFADDVINLLGKDKLIKDLGIEAQKRCRRIYSLQNLRTFTDTVLG